MKKYNGTLGQHPMNEERRWKAAVFYAFILLVSMLVSAVATAVICYQAWA